LITVFRVTRPNIKTDFDDSPFDIEFDYRLRNVLWGIVSSTKELNEIRDKVPSVFRDIALCQFT
jgi:hypothetical protein